MEGQGEHGEASIKEGSVIEGFEREEVGHFEERRRRENFDLLNSFSSALHF